MDKYEELFRSLCNKNGYKCFRHSNKIEDINEHWDFLLFKDANFYKIDIKGKKHIRRNGRSLKNSICVEWKNVNGDPGWIYGRADIIAFFINNEFLLYKRRDLLNSCLDITDFEKRVDSFSESKNCVYRREYRKDLISLVQLSEICEPIEIWKIEES